MGINMEDAIFQSTPPVKAATKSGGILNLIHIISIHAAREGGDQCAVFKMPCNVISIHAAREGGDAKAVSAACKQEISIHAAREGGDACPSAPKKEVTYFNPRRP